MTIGDLTFAQSAYLVLLIAIVIVEMVRALKYDNSVRDFKKEYKDKLKEAFVSALKEGKEENQDKLIRSVLNAIKTEFDDHESNSIKRAKTLVHDAQQIKTGDEASKKREHEIIKKLDRIGKKLEIKW